MTSSQPHTSDAAMPEQGGSAMVHIIEPCHGDDALLALTAIHHLDLLAGNAHSRIEAIAAPTARQRCAAAGVSVARWHTGTLATHPYLGMLSGPTLAAAGREDPIRCAWSPNALRLSAFNGALRESAMPALRVGVVDAGPLRLWQSSATDLGPWGSLRGTRHAGVFSLQAEALLHASWPTGFEYQPDRLILADQLDIDPNRRIIGMIDGNPSGPDSRHFSQVVGITRLGGGPVTALISEFARSIPRAARFVKGFLRTWDMVVHHGPAFTFMPAWDLAVWLQATPGDITVTGIPQVLAALARGVPIITTDSPIARAVIGNHPDIRSLAVDYSPPALGSAVLELSQDLARAEALAAAQHAHCLRALATTGSAGAVACLPHTPTAEPVA